MYVWQKMCVWHNNFWCIGKVLFIIIIIFIIVIIIIIIVIIILQ